MNVLKINFLICSKSAHFCSFNFALLSSFSECRVLSWWGVLVFFFFLKIQRYLLYCSVLEYDFSIPFSSMSHWLPLNCGYYGRNTILLLRLGCKKLCQISPHGIFFWNLTSMLWGSTNHLAEVQTWTGIYSPHPLTSHASEFIWKWPVNLLSQTSWTRHVMKWSFETLNFR